MSFRGAIIVCSIIVSADAALAASITNRDDKDYKLTIVEGATKQVETLKPNAALSGVCPKGCIVRIGDSENDEYELEGTEIVSIEDGYLYFDGSDGPADAAQGKTAPPPPSPTGSPTK